MKYILLTLCLLTSNVALSQQMVISSKNASQASKLSIYRAIVQGLEAKADNIAQDADTLGADVYRLQVYERGLSICGGKGQVPAVDIMSNVTCHDVGKVEDLVGVEALPTGTYALKVVTNRTSEKVNELCPQSSSSGCLVQESKGIGGCGNGFGSKIAQPPPEPVSPTVTLPYMGIISFAIPSNIFSNGLGFPSQGKKVFDPVCLKLEEE